LVVQGGYPFDHWMFIWNGEVIRIHINKVTKKVTAASNTNMSEDDAKELKQFVDTKLEEIYDTPDTESGD